MAIFEKINESRSVPEEGRFHLPETQGAACHAFLPRSTESPRNSQHKSDQKDIDEKAYNGCVSTTSSYAP